MKLFLSYRSLLLLLLILAGAMAAAQDSATSRFIDSLKKPAPPPVYDTVVANTEESSDSSDTGKSTADEEIPADTAITSDLRPVSPDTLALVKKDKGFYYQEWLDSLLRDDEAKMKVTKESQAPDLPNLDVFFTVFKIVLWILATAILFFVLYKLFLGKNALFLTNRKNIDVAIDIEEQPAIGQYDGLIKKAVAAKNYRLAVRYLHLQLLYNLSEKNYIVLGTEKTNYQYINELRKRSLAFAQTFSSLTLKYEYIWYGEYPVSDTMFDALKHSFNEFNKETGSL